MDRKRLLIIATLDTKGREAAYVKECAESLGVQTLVMDVSTLTTAQMAPDISRDEVAGAAGYTVEQLLARKDRPASIKAMEEGGTIVVRRLVEEGRISGVFGMGGGTGTAIVTSIMRALPFGLPKVVVSTVASRDIRQFIGTKDIVMFHSVADLLGLNAFMRLILGQAVGAVCGMMGQGSRFVQGKPMVAVTAYGINSACATWAEPLLNRKGYEMLTFHANGCGGMAMEELVGQGVIAGVLDLTPHELADEMFGGYCKGIGPARLETAGRMGVPLLFAPGGLDNAVFSPVYPMPEGLRGRRIHGHDVRFCVRMEASEMEKFARIVADKLNLSRGPAYVLIPRKGWSEADKEGMELFDPDVDRVFTAALKGLLDPRIPVEEMDAHLCDPVFASRAVEILDEMIRDTVSKKIDK